MTRPDLKPTISRLRSPRTSWHQLRYAYHEAGHAVLGHWFGRCISEVSLVPDEVTGEFFEPGLRGHCLFDIFAESEHHVPGWQPGHRNFHLIAILFGGVLANVVACQEHGWNLFHWNHGYGRDFVAIEYFLDRLKLTPEVREIVRSEQEELALDLVVDLWPAIANLASTLAIRGRLQGHTVHRLIQGELNPGLWDWRMELRET